MSQKKLCVAMVVVFCLCMDGSLFAQDKTYTDSIGMEFVLIPAGSFMMGGDRNFEDADHDETPRHRVTISKPFYMGKYEVTQEQWMALMSSNPSKFKGRSRPVEKVSWDDAQVFISALNRKEGKEVYRLPTEAEWEYAARADSTTAYFFGNDKGGLGQYAWYGYGYDGNSGEETHPAGQLRANPWGLHDMSGNVWEWCQDWYGDKYYANSPSADPTGPSSGSARVIRGGSWYESAVCCRSAHRGGRSSPDIRNSVTGFRLVRIP